MSIDAKHAYRFGFLKSDEWKTLRLACLARDGARCRICDTRDLSNDAHHIFYPKNWWETKLCQLKTLCRPCHEKVHAIMELHPDFNWKQIRRAAFPENHPKKRTGAEFKRQHIYRVTPHRIRLLTILKLKIETTS